MNVIYVEINIILFYYFRVIVKIYVFDKFVFRVFFFYDVMVVFGILVFKL